MKAYQFFGLALLGITTFSLDAMALPVPDGGLCNTNGANPCLWVQQTGNANAFDAFSTYGVGAIIGSTTNYAIRAASSSNTAVYAKSHTNMVGVYGESVAGHGVHGYAPGSGGRGVVGQATSSGWGVYGVNTDAAGYAGYFNGNVHVTGTLSKSAGSFMIDHPQDRANKILRHSFVESPDMKNIYDGVVALDQKGEAWVQLPEYFEALNRDFRYQLTNIGGWAGTYVSREIQGNKFKISGGKAGMKVSWLVTGTRKDAWAEDQRIVVEETKSPSDRGKFLYARRGEEPMGSGIRENLVPAPVKTASR